MTRTQVGRATNIAFAELSVLFFSCDVNSCHKIMKFLGVVGGGAGGAHGAAFGRF